MEGYLERRRRVLTAAGYRWYETANFCLQAETAGGRDLRSLHNLAYWRGRDYLGIGIGAVSTVGGLRWRNAPRLRGLPRGARCGPQAATRGGALVARAYALAERAMLALRLDQPLPLRAVRRRIRPRGAGPDGGARARRAKRPRRGEYARTDRARALRRRRSGSRVDHIKNLQNDRIVVVSTDLSERQSAILRNVVEEYVATGQPVGSKTLVERGGMTVSASTVRSELAELELRGLLTHPHTSAGRVPTDARLPALRRRPARAARAAPRRFSRSSSARGVARSRRRSRRRPRCSRS